MKIWTNQNLSANISSFFAAEQWWLGWVFWEKFQKSFGCVTLTCMETKPRAMMRWRAGTAACGHNHFSVFLTIHENNHCASRHHGNWSKEQKDRPRWHILGLKLNSIQSHTLYFTHTLYLETFKTISLHHTILGLFVLLIRSWFPSKVMLRIKAKKFWFGFIRPENFVSLSLRVF